MILGSKRTGKDERKDEDEDDAENDPSLESKGQHESVIRWLRIPRHLPRRRSGLLQKVRAALTAEQDKRRIRGRYRRVLPALRPAPG